MNKVDRYFPYEEKKEDKKNETIDMEQVSNVIKVQIDNAMKSVVEELKNNIKKDEVNENGNNLNIKQRTVKEGEISPNAEPGNTNDSEC